MRIAYIQNTIDRFDITPRCTKMNRDRALHPIRQFIVTDNGSTDERIKRWGRAFSNKFIENKTNIGNPQALNRAMDSTVADLIVIAGNDIELPKGWLAAAIKVMAADPKVALIGFGERGGVESTIGGVRCLQHKIGTTGTWVIRKSNIKTLGYFATFSKYGFWDGDYCNRLRKAGLKDVYLADYEPKHICVDHGTDTDYRKMKDAEAKKAWPGVVALSKAYTADAHYLTADCKLMNTKGKEIKFKIVEEKPATPKPKAQPKRKPRKRKK